METIRFNGAVVTTKPIGFVKELEKLCERFGGKDYHFKFG